MDGNNEITQCPVAHHKTPSPTCKDENMDIELEDELVSSDTEPEGETAEKQAELDDEDIHSMLESGVQQSAESVRRTYTRVVMRPLNEIDLHVLPEDWIEVSHFSGIPVYLDRRRRVISVSRPYHLGNSSVRRHAIPVSAIPCLHYRRSRLQEGRARVHDVACVTEDIQTECGLSDAEAVQRVESETEAQRVHHVTRSASSGETPPAEGSSTQQVESPKAAEKNKVVEEAKAEERPSEQGEDMEEGEILSESEEGQERAKPSERRKRASERELEPKREPESKPDATSGVEGKAKSATDSAEPPEKKAKNEEKERAKLENVESTVISVQEKEKDLMLDALTVREYCKRLFEFEEEQKVRFKSLKNKFRYIRTMKKMTREMTMMPEKANLIRYKVPLPADAPPNAKPREFVTNPAGKSFICILHEYCQMVVRKPPTYRFLEMENSTTPYAVTVILNGSVYGQGFGDSKKRAKLNAAKATLEMLIPGFAKVIAQMEEQAESTPASGTGASGTAGSSGGAAAAAKAAGLVSSPGKLAGTGRGWRACSSQDLELFDSISVTDRRLQELSMRMALPGPHAILTEYLRRQCINEQSIVVEMSPKTNQRSQFTMSVKGEKVTVSCRSKREGRHLAAQALLQRFHPHITTWSGILKLYGPGSKPDRKVDQEVITELQSREKGSVKSSLIDLLRSQMKSLAEEWEEHGETSKGKFFIAPSQLPFMDFHPDSQNEAHIE